jgi:DNA-binding transcriptional ArsR family regulator
MPTQLLYLTNRLFNRQVNQMMSGDRLSDKFAALADPTRRAILARLALGETSVTELAGPFEMSLPAVSKHLKVLERAGLIARGREAQWRPCRIEVRALKEVDEWLEEYRRLWEDRLDRLEVYLSELQADQSRNKELRQKKRRRKNKK